MTQAGMHVQKIKVRSHCRSIKEKQFDMFAGKKLRGHVLLQLLLLPLLLFSDYHWKFCKATDTITSNQLIRDSGTVTSKGGVFKLGFFSPINSTDRYVGIWFNHVSVFTVVWVANRDKPLKHQSSGSLRISQDGNLVVMDEHEKLLWSSNVTASGNGSAAQLLDSGNLVLRDINAGRIIWESFHHPTDVFLSNMKLVTSTIAEKNRVISSWKSISNPSTGSFSIGLNPLDVPELVVWREKHTHWRSGPYNGLYFIGISSEPESAILQKRLLVDDGRGTVSFTFAFQNSSFFAMLDSQGNALQKIWDAGHGTWKTVWSAIMTQCDLYGKCGPFGTCNSEDSPICSCLKGFEPKDTEEWQKGNWSGGCIRKRLLRWEENNSSSSSSKEDGFLKLKNMKTPDLAEWSPVLEGGCRDKCLKNCSCIAYAYATGIGCMTWARNLIDIQKFSHWGADLYIRVAYSELEEGKERVRMVDIISTVAAVGIPIAICSYFSRRWTSEKRVMKQKSKVMSMPDKEEESLGFLQEPAVAVADNMKKIKLPELKLFSFERLAAATNNFHIAYKLGQGGFGPVYKGKLRDGQEVAVKRLSSSSGQGIKEFMNEVQLISRLQHRNLVRLLGCCVEREEKMLIYEFMPNKSLDAFLFELEGQKVLDWSKRFNIVGGICRGMLYLHRDSRLRIIHRDLKASNILLDEELNPKISDFGMARIFRGNQEQDNTKRVVGTYGYMSPEYAINGHFSEKSDVFSFGVLLLEIVSGKRNTSFYHDTEASSLVGFAWKLWNEGNLTALVDPTISKEPFEEEILRCIHVGLLCVQELAKDRPTISAAISMINNEIAELPFPKQPAYYESRIACPKSCSINNVTMTMIDAR